jgi:HD-GYP domain-containing protein (c-di-GMP phosphodiesterase class II)
VSKHAGGNQVSTAELISDGDGAASQHRLISGYIEGFLQRESTRPEHLEELVATLRKLGGDPEPDARGLREGIEALARASELRDHNASGHGEQCGHYAGIIARGLNLPPQEAQDIAFAARVHDVGKLFVPEAILNKPGPLTEDEMQTARAHSRAGAELLQVIPDSGRFEEAILSHHEAFDGSGYPAGLRGEEIPLWARIIAVADAYVNMTSDRSFAPAKSDEQALAELEQLSGTRFDGMIVRVFARQLKTENASRFDS